MYYLDKTEIVRKSIMDFAKVLNDFVNEFSLNADIVNFQLNALHNKSTLNNVLYVGVYLTPKNKIYYHLVSNSSYVFDVILNCRNWVLQETFTINTFNNFNINTFVTDLDYFLEHNDYAR